MVLGTLVEHLRHRPNDGPPVPLPLLALLVVSHRAFLSRSRRKPRGPILPPPRGADSSDSGTESPLIGDGTRRLACSEDRSDSASRYGLPSASDAAETFRY